MPQQSPQANGAEQDGHMDDLTEIRSRLLDALATIETGLDRLHAQAEAGDGADPVALAAALEDERVVTAQLEQRVRTLKERQDQRLAALDGQIMAQRDQIAALDAELQRLRQANADLRDVAGQMRSALSEAVAEPELVNRAMLAEIEALRATRAADMAEVNAVLAELKPLVEEAK
jgi:chromosome segregation ATPase